MLDLSTILAQQESDPIMKIIFFVIFAIIWGVGALAKMMSKKKEQEHRERVRREIEESKKNAPDWGEIASAPPAQRPPVPQPASERPRPVQMPSPPPWQQERVPPKRPPPVPKQRQPKPPKKPRKQPQVSPPPVVVEAESAYTTQSMRASAASPAKRASTNVEAGQLRAWLQPQTLRDQFILTEILQPPLAMRRHEID